MLVICRSDLRGVVRTAKAYDPRDRVEGSRQTLAEICSATETGMKLCSRAAAIKRRALTSFIDECADSRLFTGRLIPDGQEPISPRSMGLLSFRKQSNGMAS